MRAVASFDELRAGMVAQTVNCRQCGGAHARRLDSLSVDYLDSPGGSKVDDGIWEGPFIDPSVTCASTGTTARAVREGRVFVEASA